VLVEQSQTFPSCCPGSLAAEQPFNRLSEFPGDSQQDLRTNLDFVVLHVGRPNSNSLRVLRKLGTVLFFADLLPGQDPIDASAGIRLQFEQKLDADKPLPLLILRYLCLTDS
jgi:hypothetical protein